MKRLVTIAALGCLSSATGPSGCSPPSPATRAPAAGAPADQQTSPAPVASPAADVAATYAPGAEVETAPPSPRQARLTARGYGKVNLKLPRLRHEGGDWQLDGNPVALTPRTPPTSTTAKHRNAAAPSGPPVVLEGKMILDDSLPRRRVFWVAPHYDGCVDKHERLHRPHWVRVSLPPGQSVQVTDQPLYIQGIPRRVGPQELVFDASVVQIQASVVPQGGSR